jgi:Calcineurin-like phosphoesterase
MLKLGVVSDLHYDLDPPPGRGWINAYEPDEVERRLAEALAQFRDAGIDCLVLLGDLTDAGDRASLERILSRLDPGVPAAAVIGNHDLAGGAATFGDACRAAGVRLLADEPLDRSGIELSGVPFATFGDPPSAYRTARPPVDATPAFRVVASHFPILPEAGRLAAAGLPHPRGLDDREQLAAALAATGDPVLVLSGHIHVRCSQAAGSILQLGFASLIEPPFDCALVEIAADPGPRVERRARRLGPPARIDPVLAPDRERWAWADGAWRPEPASP